MGALNLPSFAYGMRRGVDDDLAYVEKKRQDDQNFAIRQQALDETTSLAPLRRQAAEGTIAGQEQERKLRAINTDVAGLTRDQAQQAAAKQKFAETIESHLQGFVGSGGADPAPVGKLFDAISAKQGKSDTNTATVGQDGAIVVTSSNGTRLEFRDNKNPTFVDAEGNTREVPGLITAADKMNARNQIVMFGHTVLNPAAPAASEAARIEEERKQQTPDAISKRKLQDAQARQALSHAGAFDATAENVRTAPSREVTAENRALERQRDAQDRLEAQNARVQLTTAERSISDARKALAKLEADFKRDNPTPTGPEKARHLIEKDGLMNDIKEAQTARGEARAALDSRRGARSTVDPSTFFSQEAAETRDTPPAEGATQRDINGKKFWFAPDGRAYSKNGKPVAAGGAAAGGRDGEGGALSFTNPASGRDEDIGARPAQAIPVAKPAADELPAPELETGDGERTRGSRYKTAAVQREEADKRKRAESGVKAADTVRKMIQGGVKVNKSDAERLRMAIESNTLTPAELKWAWAASKLIESAAK